jgi:ribosomal protein L9
MKQVASGYARNYLVPEKLARPVAVGGKGSLRGLQLAALRSQSNPTVPLDSTVNNSVNATLSTSQTQMSSISAEEEDREVLMKKEAKMRRKIETIVSKLTESTVTFKAKAGSDGILEDPIGPTALASAVGKQLGIEIVPKLVDMDSEDVLQTSGDFLIPLNLIKSDGTKASLQVRIQAT